MNLRAKAYALLALPIVAAFAIASGAVHMPRAEYCDMTPRKAMLDCQIKTMKERATK